MFARLFKHNTHKVLLDNSEKYGNDNGKQVFVGTKQDCEDFIKSQYSEYDFKIVEV